MKKLILKSFFILLLLGISSYTNAQTIDSKSKDILDSVTKNYESKKNIYFQFTFGSGINGQVTKTEPGTFISSNDLYKLKIMGTEQIYDGNKIYNISAEDQEITIAKPNSTDALFSPLTYLKTYRKEFNVSYIGKREAVGKITDVVKLTPVKPNGLKAVFLFIDTDKKQLIKMEQIGNNKDVAVVAVKDYKENQKLESDIFKFNKKNYKDYIITEL